MASPATATGPPAATVPDEDPSVDLPMTMTASVILTNLPRDASQALTEVEALDRGKGVFFFLS
jgi:ubiquitin-like protein ATG12